MKRSPDCSAQTGRWRWSLDSGTFRTEFSNSWLLRSYSPSARETQGQHQYLAYVFKSRDNRSVRVETKYRRKVTVAPNALVGTLPLTGEKDLLQQSRPTQLNLTWIFSSFMKKERFQSIHKYSNKRSTSGWHEHIKVRDHILHWERADRHYYYWQTCAEFSMIAVFLVRIAGKMNGFIWWINLLNFCSKCVQGWSRPPVHVRQPITDLECPMQKKKKARGLTLNYWTFSSQLCQTPVRLTIATQRCLRCVGYSVLGIPSWQCQRKTVEDMNRVAPNIPNWPIESWQALHQHARAF